MVGLNVVEVIVYSSVLLGLFSVVKFVYSLWWRPKALEKHFKKQGIGGTSYKLVYGDNRFIHKMMLEAWSIPMALNHKIVPRVDPFLYHTVKRYGKISMSWFGTRARLTIADAELMKLILTDKNGHFRKPPHNPLVSLLSRGLSTLEGEKWANRRRLITPAFHHEKLQGMLPAFSACCCNLIDRWKKLVAAEGSAEVDVAPELQNLSSDVIARTAFGSSYEQGKKIFELQKEQAVLVIQAFHALYFPGLRFLPTKKNRRRYQIDAEIKAMLRDTIIKKQRAIADGEPANNDLLGLLLECKEQRKNKMTLEDIIEECKLFYFAGQETTANWLTWTLIVLSMHPNWQQKARQEVQRVCGKRKPEPESLNQLKTATMVLYEVLRLYPPVIGMRRTTIKDTEIGGISIPAGVQMYLPTILLHRASEYWGEDAEEFKPERFAEGVSKASNDQLAFFPFSWGPRFCLGQSFALMEAKLALASILQNFSFKLSPAYIHAPHTVITLQPQHGAPIILQQV